MKEKDLATMSGRQQEEDGHLAAEDATDFGTSHIELSSDLDGV